MTTPIDSPVTKRNGVLATDLDGTLIPLEGNQQNKTDLQTLSTAIRQNKVELVFVTGRHLKSVESAIIEYNMPQPDWVICDVGTSVFRRKRGGRLEAVDSYRLTLQDLLERESISSLREHLEVIPDLRLQESEKQGQFKLSFYTDGLRLESCKSSVTSALNSKRISHEIIASVDPFNGDGLIDVLPPGVSKAFAINWLASFCNLDRDSIIFAGDSGNDFTAMTAGYKTIVVGNADQALVNRVKQSHNESGWTDLLYTANEQATSGVLAGCQYFGVV